MPKVKLSTPDKRMLQLLDMLKQKGTIRFTQEFCDAIDMPKQNIRNIKLGMQYFTVTHIQNACRIYNINANWILGLSEEVYMRRKSAVQISPHSLQKR